MTIYISQGRYTAAAIRAMTAKPEDRSEAIAELLAAVGGRLIGWYLTLGRYDWLIVAEAPDERTLISAVLAAAAGGSLSDITTTVALSAEDTVKAFGQAGELSKRFRSAGAPNSLYSLLHAIRPRGRSRHLAVLAQPVQGLMLTEAAQFEMADFKDRCCNFGGKSTSHKQWPANVLAEGFQPAEDVDVAPDGGEVEAIARANIAICGITIV